MKPNYCWKLALSCLMLSGAANASLISSVYTGNVGAAVAAYPDAASPGAGTLSIAGLPVGATILNATLLTENYFSNTGATATFAGNSLGSATLLSSDGGANNLAGYSWDVTSLVTGNGNYSASYAGPNNTYGLALVVVYSSASLSANGRVQVLAGAVDICGASACSVTNQFTGFAAGSGNLWIHTGADDSASGETINLNGAAVGGPINANLGNYASLFSIPVTAVAGTNTINITSLGDQFDWNLAVLYGSGTGNVVPEPAAFSLIGIGLAALVLRKRRTS